MSILSFLRSDESDRKIHAILAAAWLLLAIPAVLWWRNSVSFVVFASVYANVAGHWGAYQAAKGEKDLKEKVEDVDDHSDATSDSREPGGEPASTPGRRD
jgi:hypothetical protein